MCVRALDAIAGAENRKVSYCRASLVSTLPRRRLGSSREALEPRTVANVNPFIDASLS